MAGNNRIHEMPITRGVYQLKGVVSGTEKQNFYTEKKTKTNKEMRTINFGVEYDHGKTVYMSMNGIPRDKVYFSKKDDETGKIITKAVDWKNRLKSDTEGYRLIGVNLGIEKTTDEKGKEINDKKTMPEFDACKYMSEKMEDDMSVFVKGNLEFGSYTNKDGEVSHTTKFVPTQVSLCQKDIDFEAEDYAPAHDFMQTIVFVGIDQERENDKPTGRFVVDAKIVNYNSIESAEFIIEDAKLAKQMRSGLKPYNSIQVHGHINVVNNVEDVNDEEDDDCWGESNDMDNKRVFAPTHRELIITGAKPSTIDKDTYTEKAIDEAIKKVNASKKAEQDFTGKAESTSNVDDDWGDDASDDEDEPW